MVGGAPVTPEWADKIGADGYASNAPEAVELARKLVGEAQL
jgi:methanogenic corrinoid protein MtbC1